MICSFQVAETDDTVLECAFVLADNSKVNRNKQLQQQPREQIVTKEMAYTAELVFTIYLISFF